MRNEEIGDFLVVVDVGFFLRENKAYKLCLSSDIVNLVSDRNIMVVKLNFQCS